MIPEQGTMLCMIVVAGQRGTRQGSLDKLVVGRLWWLDMLVSALPPSPSSHGAHQSAHLGLRYPHLLPTALQHVQIQALKNMGYNISRAKLSEDSKNKFFITKAESAEKVTRSAELEDIRQCIMHTMVDFHPEAASLIVTGGSEMAASSTILGADGKVAAPFFMASAPRLALAY
jgi:hypothetical protein